MNIRILGWRAKGLRGALSKFEIDVSSALTPNVLIQMPTGTGKTTTISLIRKALAGESFSSQEISNFRAESQPPSGRFELSLSLDDVTAKIVIEFDFEDSKAKYSTVLSPGGNKTGYVLPRPYDRLLTPALTRLFVFDGELAAELRDQELTRAEEAIESLYRLSVIAGLKEYAEETLNLKRKRNVHSMGHTNSTVTRRTTKRDEAASRLDELKKERGAAVTRKEQIDADLEGVLDEIKRLAEHSMELDEAFERAKDVFNKATSILDERHFALCRNWTRPQSLHAGIAARLDACYNKIEAAKLPGPSSSEWFEWLAEQEQCVCGRPISTHEKDEIRSHMDRYLGGEQHGLINEIKSALKSGAAATAIDSQATDGLSQAAADYRDARQRRVEAEDRRVREAGGDIDALRERQRELEGSCRECQTTIERLDAQDAHSWRDSIPICSRELQKRQEALNEAEGTNELFQKVEFFKRLLDDVQRGTVAKVRAAIQTRTNRKLTDVIHSEHLSIEAIEKALVLTGMSRLRDDVSVGQSLAIAYAFLTSLFEHAAYKLPFVVDSPAGPIDVLTRQRVSKLLPEMFPQLIMFVQSGERVGFVEAFYERNDVQYLTCWRDDGNVLSKSGRETFEAFHTEDNAASGSEETGQ